MSTRKERKKDKFVNLKMDNLLSCKNHAHMINLSVKIALENTVYRAYCECEEMDEGKDSFRRRTGV